jgi:pimeloyl-ACP methyl ester carboxylesterase
VNEPRLHYVEGDDGTQLAVHRLGAGRPVLLLHGLFSSAQVNWIKYGHAARLAEAGFEAIMPDLRAHGQSAAPHDPSVYPSDVLVTDVFAVVKALDLADFDLCGFSLGARTAVRAVLAGLAPGRLVLGGMGIEGLGQWERRSAFFIDAIDNFETIERGDPHYLAQQFMKTMKVDRVAVRLLLGSVDDTSVDALRRITMPTLVVCGGEDHDNGSAPSLAEALPDATYAEVPGTHMSSVTQRQLGEAIVRFLLA